MTPEPGPVLVTGAAGFIGARFVESCNASGESVLSVDETDYFARPEHAGIDFGTVVDPDALIDGIEAGAHAPRAIVHLGACTDTTELDLELLRRRNLEYSRGLWRFAAARGIPFVYASSAATYGAGEHGWDDDEATLERLRPLNPYGRSKHDFDRWALAQDQAGEAPPAWSGFKFFNVYGFGERHKGRMASVVLQAFDQINGAGRVWLFRSHRDDVEDGHQ